MKQEGTAMNPVSMKRLAAWILCAAALGASSALAGSPNVTVSGTVTDGSGHGWPLYARIEITSAFTDRTSSFRIPSPAPTPSIFRARRPTRSP